MSINWVMIKGNSFEPLPGEQQLHVSPARTALSIQSLNKFPGKEPVAIQSSAGRAFLTNRRLVYLPATATPSFQSFAAPLLNFHDTHVTAPFFGPNVWMAAVQPVSGGGIPAQHAALEMKITFKDGGAYDFHGYFERIKERLQQVVSVAQEAGYGNEASNGAGVNTSAVHLEDLPAYESYTSSRRVEDATTAYSVEAAIQPSEAAPGAATTVQPTAQAAPTTQTQPSEPPSDLPPSYEEAQISGITEDMERTMRPMS